MSMGRAVRTLRLMRGWTQGELADKIGKTRGYIANLERDHYKDPGSSAVEALARAFEITMDDFFVNVRKPPGEFDKMALDEYIMFLQSAKPTADTVEKLREITESLLQNDGK